MSLLKRMSNLRSRFRIDREVKEELRAHIEMRTDDNIADGMSPEDARRNALLRFGNPTVIREKIVTIDTSFGGEKLLRDLLFAFRQFQRHPTFALTVVGTIALGIGATVAVFSVVHSVLLRPLPYRNPDQLVVAYGNMVQRSASDLPFSSPDFVDLKRGATRMFEGFAGLRTGKLLLQRQDGGLEQVQSATVTTNFFGLLGGRIILGRDFREEDAPPASRSRRRHDTATGKSKHGSSSDSQL